MKYIYISLSIIFFSKTLFAQDSTQIDLDAVTVTANIQQTEIRKTARNVSVITAKDIENAPVKTLDGILQYALNVDVRSRSPLGVQADISIRGGNFDQTLILVDGVKMNDPQTGHHSLNLPLPVNMIERIEILQGGASRVFGPSAFAGAINIITKKNQDNQLQLNAAGGQHGLYQLNATMSASSAHQSTIASAEKIKSDGYVQNTAFEKNSLFFKSIIGVKAATFTISAGAMNNDFGASNFYHPKFYKQYEEVKSKFLMWQWGQNFSNHFFSNFTASWRRHNDMYDFDNYRYTKPASINFHQTDVWDIEWKSKWINSWGITSFGAEFRREYILSNRLGDKLEKPIEVPDFANNYYTFSKTRDNSNLYFEHLKQFEKLSLVFGTLVNHNSQFGTDFYPGLDISYAVGKNISFYSSLNRSLRYPTFTEMYLNSSTVKADPNIKPEKAWGYEIGAKRFEKFSQSSVTVFYKDIITAIDKVKRPELAVPTMENINNLHTLGFEGAYTLFVGKMLAKNEFFLQKITANYAYIWADKKEDGFQSFYTLNYLRHKASVGVNMRLAKNLHLDSWFTIKKRMGEYQWDAASPLQVYKTNFLLDTRLTCNKDNLRCWLDGTNLLNQKYFDFGFVAQPGRWLTAGVSYIIK